MSYRLTDAILGVIHTHTVNRFGPGGVCAGCDTTRDYRKHVALEIERAVREAIARQIWDLTEDMDICVPGDTGVVGALILAARVAADTAEWAPGEPAMEEVEP